jgi:integral membrane protein
MKDVQTLRWFKHVAFAEGISFIVLLFIAMPLKYWGNMPMAVRYVGSVHGGLFVLFCILLFMVWKQYNWSLKEVGIAFALSLIPFGTFFLDKKLKAQINAIQQ